jgi:predicted LPLAT superfamily acyltransferase
MGGSEGEPGAGARRSQWGQIGERGSALGIRFTLACYRLFGRTLTSPLIFGIVVYFFLTDSAGRRASRDFLRRVHEHPEGRRALPRRPGLGTSFRHYHSFGRAIVDRLALWLGGGDEFEFETRGTERIDALAAEGRGALILGAHLGSFDALRLLAKRSGNVVNALMFTDNAQRINSVFEELSPEAAARIITVEPDSVHAVFAIRECLRRGEHVAILADRLELGERDRSREIPLLGDPVALPRAPADLAVVLRCPVFLMLALRRGAARYRVEVEPLFEGGPTPRGAREEVADRILARYVERLEHYCLAEPLQWFNFFDYWGDAAADRRRSTHARERRPRAVASGGNQRASSRSTGPSP